MTWPLPRPNPPPLFFCFPRPQKFPPPQVGSIFAVVNTDFVEIADEDIMVVEIVLVDIEQANTKAALVQVVYAHHSSSSRYPPSFLAVVEVLCIISHLVLLIYTIYSID